MCPKRRGLGLRFGGLSLVCGLVAMLAFDLVHVTRAGAKAYTVGPLPACAGAWGRA